jgi:ring-1,2-phenylacetyl-CoA epoxidase subunit PaaE
MEAVQFHDVTVSAVDRLTDQSVVVTLDVPDALADRFRHIPGQHLILRHTIDDQDVRRSYSICSPAGERPLRVGIKHLEGGVFSTWANAELAPGVRIQATPPTGEFIRTPRPSTAGRSVAIAAGSGITPVLSIVASTLRDEPDSEFTLVYGNRDGGSVMFLDEIDALKGRYPDRLMVVHVLSRERFGAEMFTGRIDAPKIEAMCSSIIDPSAIDAWYLCGPRGMVESVRTALAALGVDDAIVLDELFYAGGDGPPAMSDDDVDGASVTFTLAGRTSRVIVDPGGSPILDHVLSVRPDGPFSCRSGACASCRARVVSGEVRMDRNWCLNEEEVAAGQILTCQSHPVSDEVEITYDL